MNFVIETPTLDRMLEVKEHSQLLGDFLEGLRDMGLTLCQRLDIGQGEQYYHYPMAIEDLLAKYFEIDLNQAEIERENILAAIRSQH